MVEVEQKTENVEDVIRQRSQVIDVLKRLKAEKEDIEINIRDLAAKAIEKAQEQDNMKMKVQELKVIRKGKLGKVSVQYNKKKEKLSKLEMSMQTQSRNLKQEKKLIKRIREVRDELDAFKHPKDATQVHEQILSISKSIDKLYQETNDLVEKIGLVSITMDGLITKRGKLEMKFKDLTQKIKELYDSMRKGGRRSVPTVLSDDAVDSMLDRLLSGETITVDDFMGGS